MQRERDFPPLDFFSVHVYGWSFNTSSWKSVVYWFRNSGVTAVLILVRHISVIADCIIILLHYLVLIVQVNVEFPPRFNVIYTVLLLPIGCRLCYFEGNVIGILVPLLCCSRTSCSFRYLQHLSAFTVVSKCQTTGPVLSPTYSVARHYDPVMAYQLLQQYFSLTKKQSF